MNIQATQADIETLSKYQVLEPNRRVLGVDHGYEYNSRSFHGYKHIPTRIREEGEIAGTPYNRSENSELIGISTENGQKRVVTVQKKEVTRWNVILSWFGLGKLGHIDLKLNVINRHLSQFNFKEFENEPVESAKYNAYKTVCKLAGMQMVHYTAENESSKLWKSLSDRVQTIHGEFFLNPGATYRHIRYQAILQGQPWIAVSKDGKKAAPTQPMTSKDQIEAFPDRHYRPKPEWL